MDNSTNDLKFRNGLKIKGLTVEPHSPEEKAAVQALLWGNCGEGELLPAPPPRLSLPSTGTNLQISLRERAAYFEKLLAALLGFANSFGGRIFLGSPPPSYRPSTSWKIFKFEFFFKTDNRRLSYINGR